MTRSISFHKQIDSNKQAGQVVYPLPKELLVIDTKDNEVIEQYDDYLIYDDEEMDPTK